MGTGFDAVRTRLSTPPLTLVALLAAALSFALAVLVGWATAGTREDVRRVQPLTSPKPPPQLVLLGHVAALPQPPPARPSRQARPPTVPRLIVGSG